MALHHDAGQSQQQISPMTRRYSSVNHDSRRNGRFRTQWACAGRLFHRLIAVIFQIDPYAIGIIIIITGREHSLSNEVSGGVFKHFL